MSAMTKLKPLFAIILFFAWAAALSACNLSLASDVTPPPNAETFNENSPLPTAVPAAVPVSAPNPQNGASLFQEKCAPCHGTTGLGDGAQGQQLSVPVPALADASLALAARPVDWFDMVTNGNMQNFMPPFSGSLDDSQRWDVVAYAMSLSLDQPSLDQGQAVFTANCASCHGDQGQGDGTVPSWTDNPGLLAQLSIMDMAATISSGKGDMPAFSGSLSQDQILAAAKYARSLSFVSTAGNQAANANPASSTPDQSATSSPDATAVAISGSVTISGKVSNGSGGTLPANLTVTLAGFDGMTQAMTLTATTDANGVYTFDNVELSENRAYMASVDYNGSTFSSDVFHSSDQPGATNIDLPISVYDTTTDSSSLRVDRMHVFFDFSDPQNIQVAELFVLNNTGTAVIVSPAAGQGVVNYALPATATNLQFQDGSLGDRYLQTDTGFTDTQSVPPGSGTQILFAYQVPYQRKLDLSIPIPLPVDSAVIMVPEGGMNLQSSQVQSMGSSEVQGVAIDFYSATSLTAGSTLDLKLSGSASSSIGGLNTQTTSLIIGIAVLVVVLLGITYWLFVIRRRDQVVDYDDEEPEVTETSDEIMDAIIALDDRYAAGEIPEEAYQERREP